VLGNDTDADNLSPTPPNTGLTVSGVGAASHGTTAVDVAVRRDLHAGARTTTARTASRTRSSTRRGTRLGDGACDGHHVADTPVANPDSVTVNEDSGATFIDVLGNDTDADNLSPTAPNAGLTVSGVGAASHGTTAFTATA
jgi:hypothetical protein